jgi:hypothetical protein
VERIAVFTADTWLHVTTKTVEFVQILPVTSMPQFSFALNETCTKTNNSFIAQYLGTKGSSQCTLREGGNGVYFVNSTQSLQVLNNVSEVATIYTYESDTPYTYLGIPEAQTVQFDYTATTFGMQTQCRSINDQCNLQEQASTNPFYCSDAFQGDLGGSEGTVIIYFTDYALSSSDTRSGIHNPYYFAIESI